MDVWGNEIMDFCRHIQGYRLVFVTCLDAFHALRKLGCINVGYLPYPVPDKYVQYDVPIKDIDIIQFGRTNPVLDSYMERFTKKYPDVEYVRTFVRDKKVYFHSSKYGVLGESDSRETFMSMLSRAPSVLSLRLAWMDHAT